MRGFISLVVAAAFIIGVFNACGGGKQKKPDVAVDTRDVVMDQFSKRIEAAAASEQRKWARERDERIGLTARPLPVAEVVQAYEGNPIAADQRFKGKRILLSGTIDDIGRDTAGNAYLAMRPGFAAARIQAFFSHADENKLASLRKGDEITIQGRCDGMLGNNILIQSVVLE